MEIRSGIVYGDFSILGVLKANQIKGNIVLDNNTSINALSTTGNSYGILSVNSSNVTTVGNSTMDTWVVSKTIPKWNNGTTTVNLATINDTVYLELSNGAELWIE